MPPTPGTNSSSIASITSTPNNTEPPPLPAERKADAPGSAEVSAASKSSTPRVAATADVLYEDIDVGVTAASRILL